MIRLLVVAVLLAAVGCSSKPDSETKKLVIEVKKPADPAFAGLSPEDASQAKSDSDDAYNAMDRLIEDSDRIRDNEKKRIAIIEHMKAIHSDYKLRKERDGIKSAAKWFRSQLYGKTVDDIAKAATDSKKKK